jgi:3-oxoacyl-[acyl-carrier-protein] synthase-1
MNASRANAAALPTLAVHGVGLVTAVGLSAPASCAAFRAKISNPTETRFIDGAGQWIMAHQVELEQPWRGLSKLARMAALAAEEALQGVPRAQWAKLPMVLCVAEPDRPGRLDGLDTQLALMIQDLLGGVRFDAARSALVAHGRVGLAVALNGARRLLAQPDVPQVLVVATDSLITWPTLGPLEREGRLLAERNSNGFMAGEAAGALLLGRAGTAGSSQQAAAGSGQLVVAGLGFAREAAHIASDEPLRGDGLAGAIRAALEDAGVAMHDIDFRISDVSGEHYYFKEAALALSRTLRQRKEDFDLWHPAECTGEVGAASGATVVALAHAACAKGYTLGSRVLAHWANDSGQRAAAVLQWNNNNAARAS